MKKLIILFTAFLIWFGCKDTDPIIIKPFQVMNRIDTTFDRGNKLIYRADYFLIEHYKNNKRYDLFIDSFLKANKNNDSNNYTQYSMILYKESDKTNVKGNKYSLPTEKFKKYTDDDDLIFSYTWFRKGGLYIDKFKDGQSINPPDPRVKISDVKK